VVHYLGRNCESSVHAAAAAPGHARALGRSSLCLPADRCGRPWSSNRTGAGQRRGHPAPALAGWLVDQPEQSLYELEPGQWRDYDAYVGHPAPAPGGMHVATFDQRIVEWRQRFLTQAAIAIGERATEFGWHRMLLAGDKPIVNDFADRLPETARERVVGVVNANVLWEEPGAVADRLEGPLDEAWRRDADKLIDRAIEAASQGGKGALGWPEVLDTLVQHRVEHIVFAADATPDPDALPPYVSDALGKPSAGMVVERAVEHAVASGAEVTAVPDDAGPLLSAGSVVATLRY
jgi:hypothetical protein